MITKKLISAAAALLLAAALCLASCGDGDSSQESGSEDISRGTVVSGAESDAGAGPETSKADASDASEESKASALPADTSAEDISEPEVSQAQEPDGSSSTAGDPSESAEPGDFNGSLTGKWELYEMISDGKTVKGQVLGIPVGILFQFEFKDDGTAEMMQSEYGKDIKRSTLNWKEKDNGLSIVGADGSSTLDFELEDGLLVGTLGGKTTLKLTQVSEFSKYDPSANSDSDDSAPADSLSEADVIGKWELEEMSSGDLTLKDNFLGMPVGVMFQFEFKSDGTGTLARMDVDTTSDRDTFTWNVSNDLLCVKFAEDDYMYFFYKKGLLTTELTEDGEELTIKITKVDGFTVYVPEDLT